MTKPQASTGAALRVVPAVFPAPCARASTPISQSAQRAACSRSPGCKRKHLPSPPANWGALIPHASIEHVWPDEETLFRSPRPPLKYISAAGRDTPAAWLAENARARYVSGRHECSNHRSPERASPPCSRRQRCAAPPDRGTKLKQVPSPQLHLESDRRIGEPDQSRMSVPPSRKARRCPHFAGECAAPVRDLLKARDR